MEREKQSPLLRGLEVGAKDRRVAPVIAEEVSRCAQARCIDGLFCHSHIIRQVHALNADGDVVRDVKEQRSIKLAGRRLID